MISETKQESTKVTYTYSVIRTAAIVISILSMLYSLSAILTTVPAIIVIVLTTLAILYLFGVERTLFYRMYDESKRLPNNLQSNACKVKGYGVLRFFRNKKATAIDVTMLVSIVLYVMLYFVANIRTGWFVPLNAITFFTFQMHCYYNGSVYNTLKNYEDMKGGSNVNKNNVAKKK